MSWFNEFITAFQRGTNHAFIVTGNIRDRGDNDVRAKFLKFGEANINKFGIIMAWDKANGLWFTGPKSEVIYDAIRTPVDPYGPSNGGETADPASIKNTLKALELMQLAFATCPTMVLIDYAESIFPAGQYNVLQETDRSMVVTAQAWGRSIDMGNRNHLIVLLTQDATALHADIRNAATHYKTVTVSYPSYEERMNWLVARKVKWDGGLTANEAAVMTSGLNLLQLEDLEMAGAETGVTRDMIRDIKDAVMAGEYAQVLEPMYPRFGFEGIGGLAYIKSFFTDNVINAMREGKSSRVPMGVLMTGPAGTGKSAMAEAVAYEAKINCVKLNLARIFGRYVGDSERNLDRALEGVKAMAPTIVFIDEIDQQLQRGEQGDSGVSNRVFSRLLEFMSDTGQRGRIIFLAATNRPDLMDAALKRPGRFDKKVPFLPPQSAEDRLAIIMAYAHKYAVDVDKSSPELELIMDRTTGWTGAELEGLFIKAVELDGRWMTAFNRYIPSTQNIEFMTELALREVNDLDLVPEQYHAEVRRLRSA